MSEEHPFAPFIRILARGPRLSRALQREEAREAMRLIVDGEVEPVQLGAFLMLLRARTETPAELAGLVDAARERSSLDDGIARPDLDWASYADGHRTPPWFTLAIKLLAASGVRILIHGKDGSGIATAMALAELGIPICGSTNDAQHWLEAAGIAYLAIDKISPPLAALFRLRSLLGLRSPVHSLARALNPLEAPHQIVGVFHPHYRTLHQETAALLGQRRAAIFKGGSGEAQRNPAKPCRVALVEDGASREEEWPAISGAIASEEVPNTERAAMVASLWCGEYEDPAAIATVTGTAAIALRLLGRADDPASADALASRLWNDRNRELPSAGVAQPARSKEKPAATAAA
jgi:anthranilate phosphoribosyltransferase